MHELDFRCRQTEEHASVQIINSFYKLCSPFQSSRQISLSVSSHCLRIKYTAGHALTSGHKQALRHASESPLSTSQANAYSTVNSTVLGQESCPSALQVRSAHIHTHIHTHETRGKAIRHVKCSRSENASKCTRSARTKNAAVENANKGGLECIKMQQILECRTN